MGKYQRKLSPLDPCPIEHIVTLVGGKWKARLLYRLSMGEASLGELQRHLPRARPQVLTAQLRAMIADGLIRRDEAEDRTWGKFEITDRSRSLCRALDTVAQWGETDIGGWTPPHVAEFAGPTTSGSSPTSLS